MKKKTGILRFIPIVLALTLLILLFPVQVALAADFYVTSGNSIQTAIDSAGAGDTIHVAAGTYNEKITLKQGVHVLGAGAGTTTLNGGNSGSVVSATLVSTATLDGFTITGGNGTGGLGGGIYLVLSSPTISNCIFESNRATVGGGIDISAFSSPTLLNCVFHDNTANVGGAIYVVAGSSPTIVNCIVYNNTAYVGGGMYNYSSSPVVTNCTFFGNSATIAGGIYNMSQSQPVFTNCILWGNGQEINNDNNNGISPAASYCDIEGGYGIGNLNADPQFVNSAGGDFHLMLASPCKDAGDNLAPSLPATDFEGDARIIDGTVDIGADEILLQSDLAIAKSASPNPVRPGYQFTYTVSVTNHGPDNATGIIVTDVLPPGLTFIWADTHGSGAYNAVSGSWTGFGLNVGATAILTIRVKAPVIDGIVVTNNAQVISDNLDPNSANNQISQNTRVFTPKSVGGEVAGISRTGLWMPWLVLSLILVAGGLVWKLYRRRRS